jgi:hypothetical protein
MSSEAVSGHSQLRSKTPAPPAQSLSHRIIPPPRGEGDCTWLSRPAKDLASRGGGLSGSDPLAACLRTSPHPPSPRRFAPGCGTLPTRGRDDRADCKSDQNSSPESPAIPVLSGRIFQTYPRPLHPWYSPSSIPLGREARRTLRGWTAGGRGFVPPPGPCGGALAKSQPDRARDQKSRAPRRLRLITLHIEAYAPRGPDHQPARRSPWLNRDAGRFRSPAAVT